MTSPTPSVTTGRSSNAPAVVFIGDMAVPHLTDLLNGKSNDPPFDLKTLTEFATREFFEENLEFFEAVREFRKTSNDTTSTFGTQATDIVTTYVKSGADRQVNLSSDMSKSTLAAVEAAVKDWHEQGGSGNKRVFDKAYDQLISLVQNDGYQRFVEMIVVERNVALSRDVAMWWKQKITLKEFFTFPDPINEVESRLHAFFSFVVLLGALLQHVLTEGATFPYLFIYIFYGHATRMLCGPKLDPQAFFVLFVARPFVVKIGLFKDYFSTGQPKQFAQFVGAIFSLCCVIWAFLGWSLVLYITAAMYGGAMWLSAFLGICPGCIVYKFLAKHKMVPNWAKHCETCEVRFVHSEV
ncbi:unnamed protein product [Chrysoparadoxa australica]